MFNIFFDGVSGWLIRKVKQGVDWTNICLNKFGCIVCNYSLCLINGINLACIVFYVVHTFYQAKFTENWFSTVVGFIHASRTGSEIVKFEFSGTKCLHIYPHTDQLHCQNERVWNSTINNLNNCSIPRLLMYLWSCLILNFRIIFGPFPRVRKCAVIRN